MQIPECQTLSAMLPAAPESSLARQGKLCPRLEHVPRLSIASLLLATTITAAILSLFQFANPSTKLAWDDVLMKTTMAIAFGWALFGGAIICWYRVRRTLWRLEPGEWLLLGVCGLVVAYILLWVASFFFVNERSWLAEGVMLGLLVLIVVPLVAGAITQRRRRWWCALQFYLLLSAVLLITYIFWGGTILSLLSMAYWYFTGETIDFDRMPETAIQACLTVAAYFPMALLTAGLVYDWRRHEPRHWLHWSGIALFGLSMLSILWPVTSGWFIE